MGRPARAQAQPRLRPVLAVPLDLQLLPDPGLEIFELEAVGAAGELEPSSRGGAIRSAGGAGKSGHLRPSGAPGIRSGRWAQAALIVSAQSSKAGLIFTGNLLGDTVLVPLDAAGMLDEAAVDLFGLGPDPLGEQKVLEPLALERRAGVVALAGADGEQGGEDRDGGRAEHGLPVAHEEGADHGEELSV